VNDNRRTISHRLMNSMLAGLQRRWRIAAVIAPSATMSWLVISHTLVAYLAVTTPRAAMFLRSSDPASLLAIADSELDFLVRDKMLTADQPSTRSKRLRQLREQVERALVSDPLEARAYRILGQLSYIERASRKADTFMQAAARHSHNESFAIHWLMQKSFEEMDYRSAVFFADVLLSTHIEFIDYIMPILGRIVDNRVGREEIGKILAERPSWRSKFLSMLGGVVTDAHAPLELLLDLRNTAAPATPQDVNSYLTFLLQHKMYDLAYYAWLQLLPYNVIGTTGFLFNGHFETSPSGSPFDWQIPQGMNFIADIASRPDDAANHALAIEFGQGRVVFPGISQTILLPPGKYMFEGYLMGEILGSRGVTWDISCADQGVIGKSEMFVGKFNAWRRFEFAIAIPENGCRAQVVRLTLAARSASEELITGIVWFDDISISRNKMSR
jgi:hypothetical protein